MKSAGFEHWDLKCSNVVLDDGDLLAIDLTNTGWSAGWRRPGRVDMIYSAGMTIVELFKGSRPPSLLDLELVPQPIRDVALRCLGAKTPCHGELEEMVSVLQLASERA